MLTFQVTSNLDKASQVELHVVDAASGMELAMTTVRVSSPVVVEEDLS